MLSDYLSMPSARSGTEIRRSSLYQADPD